MAKQPPAFLFYYKDFLASTACMSVAEVGAYLRLLCYQWEHEVVPDDSRKIARIINAGAQSNTLWRGIRERFPSVSEGTLQNQRLERVRAEVQTGKSDTGERRKSSRSGTEPAQYVRTSAFAFTSAVPPVITSAASDGDAVQQAHDGNGDSISAAAARFERFWAAYPRKVGRDAAWREWLKRSPGNALTDTMIAKVREQQASPQWLKDGGQFIPHPRTWLHQGRWQDELEVTPKNADEYGHTPPCRTHAECIAKRLGRTEPT